MTSAELHVS